MVRTFIIVSMFKKSAIASIVALIAMSVIAPNANGIEGGSDAGGNGFTVFVVSKWNANQISTCSGALLNDYVVVTAAHCINDEMGLVSNSIRIAPPGDSIEHNSEGLIVAKNTWVEADTTQVTLTYQSGSSKVTDDDLAFLTLTKPFKSNPLVRIASEDEMLKLKSSAAPIKLYGYGYTSDSGKPASNPNYMNAEFENRTHPLANSAYAKSITSNVCSGDSGGPVVNITPTQILVVGVITGANINKKCSNKGADGSYRATFTILNRYANLAFATVSRISSNLSSLSETQAALLESRNRVAELEAEVEKWSGDYSDLELEVASLREEIEKLKTQIPRTISCVKGSTIKKVTAVNPKCPSGYKLKI